MRPYFRPMLLLPLVALLRHACVHIIINSRIFINRNDQFIHYTDHKIMAIADDSIIVRKFMEIHWTASIQQHKGVSHYKKTF